MKWSPKGLQRTAPKGAYKSPERALEKKCQTSTHTNSVRLRRPFRKLAHGLSLARGQILLTTSGIASDFRTLSIGGMMTSEVFNGKEAIQR